MWKATGATCRRIRRLAVARTPAVPNSWPSVDDLVVWSQGMVFTYNSYGIAQRPFRSYSYKNQSIMALTHRLLRDVPADGESVLSRKARAGNLDPRPLKGIAPIDPSTDLLSFLKPHARRHPRRAKDKQSELARGEPYASIFTPSSRRVQTGEGSARWDDVLHGAETELRTAWRVNFLDLNFRIVTLVTGALMLILCLFSAAMMPPRHQRVWQTDSIEFALVCLLTVMFSPLSFNYAYVWLIYPTTLGLYLVLSEPNSAPLHWLKVVWIVTVLTIPALAIPMPLLAQAYGNLFVPALLLVLGLGAILHKMGRTGPVGSRVAMPHALQHNRKSDRVHVSF